MNESDYKNLILGYELLLENYRASELRKLSSSQAVLSAKVDVIGMMAEVRSYELKKGNSEAIQDKKRRNENLYQVLEQIGQLQDDNYSLIQIAKIANWERDKYKSKVEELEERIRQIEKFNS